MNIHEIDTIEGLHQYRANVIGQMTGMLDVADSSNRDLSSSEVARYDGLKDEIKQVDGMISDAKAYGNPTGQRKTHPSSLTPGTAHSPSRIAGVNARLIRAFGENRQRAEQTAYKVGQWVAGQVFGYEPAIAWCNSNYVPVTPQAAASTSVNTQGGSLVPEELEAAIISLREEYGVARQVVRIRPMGSDHRKVPRRTGGLTAYFVGEGVEGTESDMGWDNVGLTAKKLMALTRMSSEIDEDSIIDLAQTFTDEVALAFAEKEDDCLFNGDGTSTYGGMVGLRTLIIDGDHDAGKVTAAANVDTFGEVTTTELDSMVAALPNYAHRNAAWYCSRVGFAKMFQRLLEAAGGLTMEALVEGPTKLGWLGYPIIISEKMPTSTGDLSDVVMFLFGDLSKSSSLGDRRGIRVMLSEHRYFELDQVGVKGTERFDLVNHDVGDNTTAGPVVGLVGN